MNRKFRRFVDFILKPSVFLGIAVVAVVVSRWTAISDDLEINVDESLFMSQAPRYQEDIVPWRSADTTTSGPLNSWPFFLLEQIGLPLSYSLVHACAAMILVAVVFLTWATLQQFSRPSVAALGSAALLFAICRSQQNDFVHFSSELIPVLLISSAVLLITAGLFQKVRASWSWPVSAFLLGAAPWAKLQALPISGALFLCIIWMLWRSDRQHEMGVSWRRKVRMHGLITLAFSGGTLLMFAMLVSQGCFDDFWASYIVRNLSYAADVEGLRGLDGLYVRMVMLFTRHAPFREPALGTVMFVIAWVLCGCPGFKTASAAQRGFVGFTMIYGMAALGAVLTPVYGFTHYDWFVFQPVVLFAAAVLHLWRREVAGTESIAPQRPAAAGMMFGVMVLGLQLIPWPTRLAPEALPPPFNRHMFANEFQGRVSALIRGLSKGKGSLAIWGWVPSWYLTTGMKPASRHVLCHYLIDPHPLRERFREQFMKDLEQDPPAILVDAVAPGCFTWRWDGKQGMESFAALADFVARNYHLAAAIGLTERSQPVRIYARNDPKKPEQGNSPVRP